MNVFYKIIGLENVIIIIDSPFNIKGDNMMMRMKITTTTPNNNITFSKSHLA